MSPSHTRKEDRLYHYCFRQDALKRGPDACPVGRMPAGEIEAAVIDQLRGIFRQPEIVVGTCRAARAEADDITEVEVRARSLSSTRCGTSCSRPSRRGSCSFSLRDSMSTSTASTSRSASMGWCDSITRL